MKTFVTGTALAVMALAAASLAPAQNAPRTLDITWIDTEGGAATLLVAPSGESMLVDTGYAVGDRDAKRIYAATQKAGLRKIDHLMISHFHGDHMGGLAALAKMIPIERLLRSWRCGRCGRSGAARRVQDGGRQQAHHRQARRRDRNGRREDAGRVVEQGAPGQSGAGRWRQCALQRRAADERRPVARTSAWSASCTATAISSFST